MGLANARIGQLVNKDGGLYRVVGSAIVSDQKSLSIVQDTTYDVKAVAGVWLLLFLEPGDAEVLAVSDGEPSEKLHLTVGALDPKTTKGKQDIINSILEHACSALPPVRGKIGGVGQFLTDGENIPVVALFDSVQLNAWRDTLLGTLETIGVELLSDHGYTPHITLKYSESDEELPDVEEREIELGTLSLVWEGKRRDFQLKGEEDVKSRPSRSRCMHCKRPPDVDVHWADGRGRAWFCVDCFKKWVAEDDREIVRAWYIDNKVEREVPKKMGEGSEQVRKLGEGLGAEEIVFRIEKLREDRKGGPGSGNFGHAGRPGKVGGSSSTGGSAVSFTPSDWSLLDVNARRDKWESLSSRKRDKLTDAANRISENQASIISHAGDRPAFTGDVKKSISNRIDQLVTVDGEEFIPGKDAKMIRQTVNEMDDALAALDVDPKLRYQLAMEAADALVAQDRESLGRTLGDHGVHHLRGNINTAMSIIEAHPDTDTPNDIAETYIAQVFHDTGYLTDPSRVFLDEGHARWGAQHYDANIRPLVEKALGKRAAGEITHIIRTHAGTDVDWEEDVLASASRIADNMALFHKEKLPPLFRYVSSTTSILEDLGTGKITASKARQLLRRKIRSSDLSDSIKGQFNNAIGEIAPVSPKFILGMLGGSLGKVEWKGDRLLIHLRRNAEADRLQKALDLGQRQFAKFARTYGYDAEDFTQSLRFEFKDPTGQTVLESIIEEEKMLEALKVLGLSKVEREEIVAGIKAAVEVYGDEVVETLKGGPGSGNFGHAGRPGKRGGSAPGSRSGSRLPSFQVGITSARPGTSLDKIRRDMQDFEEEMRKTPVKELSVELGTGAWEGGGEPTWIVRYRGNGEALKMLAMTGKKHNQDGVLIMQKVKSGGQPLSELSFDMELDTSQYETIGNILSEAGFGGWTWGTRGGKTLLQIACIPQWGGDAKSHNAATQEVKSALAEIGYKVNLGSEQIKPTVMERDTYGDFISGKRGLDD